ncbi:MAG TPA: hypothetical protein VF334_13645 [Polyangia bacterium]
MRIALARLLVAAVARADVATPPGQSAARLAAGAVPRVLLAEWRKAENRGGPPSARSTSSTSSIACASSTAGSDGHSLYGDETVGSAGSCNRSPQANVSATTS